MTSLPRAAALAGLLAAVLAAGGCRRRTHFSSRGDASAVVVVAQKGSDDLGTLPAEVEPNNTVAGAQVLAFGGDPLAAGVAGTLPGTGKGADADVFKIVIPGLGLDAGAETAAPADALAARRLIVDLRPDDGLAPVLQLLDAAARPVVTTSAAAGERDGLPNIAVAPGGTYFLRLRAERPAKSGPDAGAGSGYRLAVRVVDFEVGDEREPNDRAAQATELSAAHTSPEAAGFFGWRRDEDWYRLPVEGLPAGTVLNLELDGVEGVSATLSLNDAAGAKMATAHGRRGERVVLRNVGIGASPTAPVVGRDAAVGGHAVYVVVRAESGRNLERRYTLHVQAELAKEGSETEPNDDPAHASPLPDGLTTGFLPPGDVDVFRYTPSGPTALDLEVTPPDRVNVKLEVLRADGTPLASADEAGRRQPERLTNVAVSEPVLVRLTQRKGDGNADEAYQLRVTSHPPAEAPR